MRIHLSTLALASVFMLYSGGCFKTTLEYVGGTNSGKPTQFKAQYRLLGCLNDEKKLVLLPNAKIDYYLTENAFYEISGDAGTKVTNTWKDGNGQYFFIYETNLNKNAYLYFIPNDPSLNTVHLRYRKGSYTIKKVDGTVRPFGSPPQGCILKKL
ncbi:MAG: hypothetical protein CVU59_08905 [Deltaproteobacteria bacterium HGW-Deltaproteobacteria-17]|nr:MAG: hypothetical protein CVU59_08905 [Deltaproteobacteria bacterium HGW-Deltaproteobacteria-17]